MSPTSYEWTVFAEIELEMQLVGLSCRVFESQLGGTIHQFNLNYIWQQTNLGRTPAYLLPDPAHNVFQCEM